MEKLIWGNKIRRGFLLSVMKVCSIHAVTIVCELLMSSRVGQGAFQPHPSHYNSNSWYTCGILIKIVFVNPPSAKFGGGGQPKMLLVFGGLGKGSMMDHCPMIGSCNDLP